MGVFDSEFLTLLITTFIITRIDPVVDFVKFLLKGLTIYLPPDNKYSSEVVKPIPKDCKDKDEYMNKEIQEVPHKVNALLELGKRDFTTYHYRKLMLYDYFWTLIFILGTSVVLVSVVFIRTFILGYPSSHIYYYVLLFLFIFCILSLLAWMNVGEKRNSDTLLLLFYFVFSVVYCLCLMSVSKFLLQIDLYSAYKEMEAHFFSLLSSFHISFQLALPKDLLAAILAILIGCIPPLLVSCAFRYAQLHLHSKSFISFLSFHLPLVILLLSCPSFILSKIEGTMIGGIIITKEYFYCIQAFLLYLWILLRIIEFKSSLQVYLNEGKGTAICDAISASMIDSIHTSRYKPGASIQPVKYPNTMYYIPNWIFAIAIQLCVPVIMIGILFTLSLALYNHYPYDGLMNLLKSYNLPLYPSEFKDSQLVKLSKEVLAKIAPTIQFESFHLFDSEIVGQFVSFLFFYVLSSYYFLQCVGYLYWKNRV